MLKDDIAAEYKRLGGQKFESGQWSKFPRAFMTADEAEEISIINTDLVEYAKLKLAEAIVGDVDIDAEWSSYLRELDKIGLQRWLEIYQGIHDRFAGS